MLCKRAYLVPLPMMLRCRNGMFRYIIIKNYNVGDSLQYNAK